MKLNTKRFGEIEVDPNTAINFPNGVLGFSKYKKYIIIDADRESPLKWLQSLDLPDLAFIVTDPLLFKPDYKIDMYKADMDELKTDNLDDIVQLVIVTVPHDPSKISINLKGPLLINSENQLGRQLVLDDPTLPLKYYLVDRKANEKAG